MSKIGIINYGLGNIKSVENSIIYNNQECNSITNASEIFSYEKIILPGVGSFSEASKRLIDNHYFDSLKEWVENYNNKLLGICLGMQLLCNSSEESDGNNPGLAFIDEDVEKLSSTNYNISPNIGWSDVKFVNSSQNEFNGDYYFVHSYGVYCRNPFHTLAQSFYGDSEFASGITNGKNIYGLQFHPEKSHLLGLSLINWFCKL